MDNYLVTDKGYEGKYVALRSPSDNTIVGYGNTPEEASNLARTNNCATPILLYVEESNMAQIYYAHPLLGVRSFLSRFTVTIDYPGQKFSLEN